MAPQRAPRPDDAPRSELHPRAEELLRHRAWLQRLTCALAGNGHDAADVEQQTWLAALRAPPRRDGDARAWLATVARNWVRRRARGDGRRRQREQLAATGEPGRPTDELAAANELASAVTAAVLGLDEPLRSVVLLRFYEGLTVRQVAARMEAPYETTRSRLRVALRCLRRSVTSDADPASRGELGPFGILGHCALAVDALRNASTQPLQGVLCMAKTAKLAAATLALAAVGTGGLWAASTLVSEPSTSDVATTPDPNAAADADPHATEVARLETRIADLERLLAERHRERVERPAPRPARRDAATNAVTGVERAPHKSLVDAALSAFASPEAPRIQFELDEVTLGRARVEPVIAAAAVEPTPQRVDLSQLSDQELLEHARALSAQGSGSPAGFRRDAWAELVNRNPIGDVRDEALFGLGIAHRGCGDHTAEEATFDRMIDVTGARSEQGERARYQRAWARYYSGNHAGALDDMESVADDAGGHTDRARHALLNGAGFARAAGDEARARRLLERLLTQVEHERGGLSDFFRSHARRQLAELE